MENSLLNNVDGLIQINEGLPFGALSELGLGLLSKLPSGIAKMFMHSTGGQITRTAAGELSRLGSMSKIKINTNHLKFNPIEQTKAAIKSAEPEINKDAANITQKIVKKSGLMKKLTGAGVGVAGTGLAADHLLPNQTQAATNTPASTQAATVSKPIINSPAAKVAEVQHAKLLNQNPWKLDSKGNVLGTHLTPQQYNQHLEQKFGADKADGAIRKAMGPGWGDGSNYHRK